MKIGLQMYTLREKMTDPASIRATMRRVKAIGYETVQLAGSLDSMAEAGRIALEEGLEVISFMGGLPTYAEDPAKTFRICKELGVTDIGISSGIATVEEAQALIADVNAFAALAAAEGITFSYHNHSNELIRPDGKTPLLAMLAEGFSENVCFTPDTYWLQHGGADVRQWLSILGPRTKVLHVKDMVRIADGPTYAEIGQGNLWWEGILPLAKSLDIPYCVVEQDICRRDPFESIQLSFDYLNALL